MPTVNPAGDIYPFPFVGPQPDLSQLERFVADQDPSDPIHERVCEFMTHEPRSVAQMASEAVSVAREQNPQASDEEIENIAVTILGVLLRERVRNSRGRENSLNPPMQGMMRVPSAPWTHPSWVEDTMNREAMLKKAVHRPPPAPPTPGPTLWEHLLQDDDG